MSTVLILIVMGILIKLMLNEHKKVLVEKDRTISDVKIELGKLRQNNLTGDKMYFDRLAEIESLKKELELSKIQNSTILSQKKSQETKTGMIGENWAPFLEGFKYDPKDCHFFSSPIDFIIYDLNSADPAIIFLEVKTGQSKLSSKQKLIKNLIRTGKIRFEEYRISTKGTKSKTTLNEDSDE